MSAPIFSGKNRYIHKYVGKESFTIYVIYVTVPKKVILFFFTIKESYTWIIVLFDLVKLLSLYM